MDARISSIFLPWSLRCLHTRSFREYSCLFSVQEKRRTICIRRTQLPVSWSIIPFVRPLAIGGLGPWQHQLPCQNSSAYICKARAGDTFFPQSFRSLSYYPMYAIRIQVAGFCSITRMQTNCRRSVIRIVKGSASPNLERYYSSKIVKHAKGKKRGDWVSECTYVHTYLCMYTQVLYFGAVW